MSRLKFIGNLIMILILFGILFSYAMFQGGFVSWFLFYSFLPIFLYQLLLLLYPWKKWSITREISSPLVQAGRDVTIILHIKRRFPFPLHYLLVEEIFPDSLHRYDFRQKKYQWMGKGNKKDTYRQMKTVVFPWFRRKLSIPYTIDHIPRGEHQLHTLRVKTGDVFGLTKKECLFTVKNKIVSYPSTLPVQMEEMVHNFEQAEKLAPAKYASNSNIVGGIREYAPGDRFSWIDWKQTAKNNTMMTKEFEQERNSSVLVVLDNCGNGIQNFDVYEATIEMALTLIEITKKRGQKVGLLSVGGKEGMAYFPSQGDRTINKRMQKYLSAIYPTGNDWFGKQLINASHQLNQSDAVIILTTNIDPYFTEAIQQTVKTVARVVLLFIQMKKVLTDDVLVQIEHVRRLGVGVCVLTEQQLVRNPIEVNFYETLF